MCFDKEIILIYLDYAYYLLLYLVINVNTKFEWLEDQNFKTIIKIVKILIGGVSINVIKIIK